MLDQSRDGGEAVPERLPTVAPRSHDRRLVSRPAANPTLSLLAVLLAILGLTAGALAARQTSDSWFYAAIGLQSALALLATRMLIDRPDRTGFALVVAAAVALRLWLVVEPPLLSGDIYRYIWDGRIVNAGFNPYLHVPADPVLAHLRDPAQFFLIDKRDYAVTIYPPVAEAFYALVTRLSCSVLAMKLAMLAAEGVAILAVARLLDTLGRSRALLALYLLHPAPLWEIANNGHVDALMMAFVFAAVAWGATVKRPYRAALLLTLGTLVKYTAVWALPAIWKPFDWRRPAFVMVVAGLCYLPFLSAGARVLGFLPSYAREQGLDTGSGFYPLAALQHLGLFQPWMVHAYLVGAVLVMVGLAVWARWQARERPVDVVRTTALLVIVFLLLLTPSLPWYYLVAAPFTALLGLWTPFAMLTGGFLLYGFNADQFAVFDRWSVLMAMIACALIRDLMHIRRPEDAR